MKTARTAPTRDASGPRRAFTLIELLTVVAILGILSAILLPTVTSARFSAKKAKTRAQFAQWAAAIESFRQEYGGYPTFETNGAGQHKVNGNTVGSPNLVALHRFYETLVGARRDGQPLVGAATGNPQPPLAQNSKRIQFITFTEADMVPANSTDPTLATKRGLIRDAFDNTDIVVLMDRNQDGAIKYSLAGGDMINALPFVTAPDSATVRVQPSITDFPSAVQGGVRAGVVFYCMPPKGTASADLLMSWK